MVQTKEERAAQRRRYYNANKNCAANKKKVAAQKKKYYQANKAKIAAQTKKYRTGAGKEHRRTADKKYYKKNQAMILTKKKQYHKSTGAIKTKLRSYKQHDRENGREFNITYDYVMELLEAQNNECAYCNVFVKLEWTAPYDPAQFSINRLTNRKGHIIGNVEITCWGCNNTISRKV